MSLSRFLVLLCALLTFATDQILGFEWQMLPAHPRLVAEAAIAADEVSREISP